MLSGRGIRSEENLKEISGMMALTAGSENKTGQDTVSFQAGSRACTEDNLSKNNNISLASSEVIKDSSGLQAPQMDIHNTGICPGI